MHKGYHLQITEGPHRFLLAGDDVIALENRDRMQIGSRPAGTVTAWVMNNDIRWNAVRLSQLLGYAAGEWSQAIFIQDTDPVVGIMAERVRMIENHRVGSIKPFTMVGSLAGGSSVYCGVRINGDGPELVLDRGGLAELVDRVLLK